MPDEGDENPERLKGSSDQSHGHANTLHRGLLADEGEGISPLMLGKDKECDEFNLDGGKQDGSRRKYHKHRSILHPRHGVVRSPQSLPATGSPKPSGAESDAAAAAAPSDDQHHTKVIVAQAWEWLHMEKQKRRLRRHRPKGSRDGLDVINEDAKDASAKEADAKPEKERRGSDGSDTSAALDELEEILRKDASLSGIPRRASTKGSRKKSHMLRRTASSLRPRRHSTAGGSSDTDHPDNEISVSTCEAWLDNSRTLSRTTGLASLDEAGKPYRESMSEKDVEAWTDFQREILRIAHTLQLKRWRRIPLERSDDIVVERLSGALTNAVYTVSPSRNFEQEETLSSTGGVIDAAKSKFRTPPSKLLLRIYGPQVEHLIDRDAELQILRRLGRQNIGPRLLGTFNNGRFEEYLHAKPLQPTDLRQPDVSRQIAKRMRELHDGIDLTRQERESGPFVWRNWDKWFERCARIVSYVDGQVMASGPASPPIARLRKRGFICGAPWEMFKSTVERFKKELASLYGGSKQLNRELIFAHNDTQYGNILRQEPPGQSPLLLPANVHKQLVVIDFEYANANTRGLEFANHFTEWCYNYHHPDLSFDCQTSYYPTPEEQQRFIRAYLTHQPQFTPAVTTPRMGPTRGSISSITSFAQGARTPSFPPLQHEDSNTSLKSMRLDDSASLRGSMSSLHLERTNSNQSEQEKSQHPNVDARVTELMQETRLWRIANSAQWVAWGIVQARVPGLYSQPHAQIAKDTATDWKEQAAEPGRSEKGQSEERAEAEEADEEFDYLSYARSRAMFFWGDCVQHGLVKKEDLPEDVQEGLKLVPY